MPLHTHLAGCLAALLVLTLELRAGRAEPPPNVTKPAPAAAAPAEPSECMLRLKASAVFTPLPAISGPGECGGDDLVRLDAFGLTLEIQNEAVPKCGGRYCLNVLFRGVVLAAKQSTDLCPQNESLSTART